MANLARRVYGVLGVSAINAMMNADFNGYPKVYQMEQYMLVTNLLSLL